MHLDHDKFFDLLVENTGMTPEKAKKQLAELLTEMKAAFDENGAYEIVGFGIFSKLGNAVHFIPAEELETEINYKYAGMEPIEMPGSNKADSEEEFEENPIKGIMGETDGDVYEDPFEDVLSEKEEDEESQDIEDPFAEVINKGEEDASSKIEDQSESEKEPEQDSAEEDKPGPEKWGINAHKQDGQESAFTGLVGDSKKDNADDEEADLSEEDPFGESEVEPEIEDDFIPVVTNVSSSAKSKIKKTDPKKESSKAKPEVAPKAPRDRRQSSPAILYVILIILVIGIAGYASVHFGLINIDGMTGDENQISQSTVPTQPEQNEISSTPTDAANVGSDREDSNAQKPAVEQPAQEQEARTSTTTSMDQNVTAEPNYGLKGTVNEAANTGYTIVLYHLSRKSGADRELKRLENKGLRTIVKKIQNTKHGVLYRVSVGQFRTMTRAARAVEENKELFPKDYSIIKIN